MIDISLFFVYVIINVGSVIKKMGKAGAVF